MTAEIAVMNQSAVALAADSAATRSETKIFSANKIFALSKYQPVAAMIYGTSACMRVPWETIIKEFRADLGESTLPRVADYGDRLFNFMSANRSLFPESEQANFAYQYAGEKFIRIRQALVEKVNETIRNTGSVNSAQVRGLADEVIQQRIEFWKDQPKRGTLPRDIRRRARERYGDRIMRVRDEVFEQLPLTAVQKERLMKVTLDSWYKQPLNGNTGLVLSGFGDEEMFPHLVGYQVDGLLLNRPIFWQDRMTSVDHTSAAVVVPFAQDDVIRLFVEGVTPDYEEFVESYFPSIVEGLSKIATEDLPTEGGVRDKAEKKLERYRTSVVTTLRTKLAEERQSLYVDPMLSIVASLPLDELAVLAESLVNLTSLRRRVSLDQETVGGPIDVAVLSKGDGLVWIKRKHYFPAELNSQFFANYFRS